MIAMNIFYCLLPWVLLMWEEEWMEMTQWRKVLTMRLPQVM